MISPSFIYNDATLILKKNGNFKKPFSYNKSGVDIEQHGTRILENYYYSLSNGRLVFGKNNNVINVERYENKDNTDSQNMAPAFRIVKIRPHSPAQLIGLQLGDIILEVNGTNVEDYTLQEVMHLFKGHNGKEISLHIERQKKIFLYKFLLQDLLN